jgi:hypothetical protein
MRNKILGITLLFVSGLALGASYREVTQAVGDDAMLATAGVAPADARLRKQCKAAVLDSDDLPDFFDCVYVQTDKSLNLFSVEDGFLMSELQLSLANIDGVALQRMGRWSQVQIWSGDRVTALYIHGNGWIDPAQNAEVYGWLLEHGAREHEPHAWIGP